MIMILAITIAIITVKNKIIIRAIFIHNFTNAYFVRATRITKRPTTFEHQNIVPTSIDCGFLCIYIKFDSQQHRTKNLHRAKIYKISKLY